jgi:hypothetical protein
MVKRRKALLTTLKDAVSEPNGFIKRLSIDFELLIIF